MKDQLLSDIIELPLLALRGIVVFPGMSAHFEVGRKKSINAINRAMSENKQICLVTQRDLRKDDPAIEDLYDTCVIANIKQELNVSGDSVRVLVEGVSRAKIKEFRSGSMFLHASVNPIMPTRVANSVANEALIRETVNVFEDYSAVSPKISPDVMVNVLVMDDCGHLADYIAANIKLPTHVKQAVLDEMDPVKRLKSLVHALAHETAVIRIENKLQKQVNEAIDQNQRDYYLREELKAIYSELGEDEDQYAETDKYIKQIKAIGFDKQNEEMLLKEAAKLPKMQSTSPEATVVRNYLDAVLELPWNVITKDKIDLTKVRKKLDADHYGLEKVKDRIIEFLAVRKLKDNYKGQIICLVGPPGIGKTSVAKSVAAAVGRKFARVSLGGIHDEAEIRGHRKTYIGSMPGRVIGAFKNAGSANPLILFDEIDKLGNDYKGDPSSAMLEVFDPEQNSKFRDNFIEIPFDLSKAIFITTANTLDTISPPLLDRMEVIELTSYTETQKFHIAKEHLVKKQMVENGLAASSVIIRDSALSEIIRYYTRESGVRTLERTIAKIFRKAAVSMLNGAEKIVVTDKNIKDFLGERKYLDDNFSDAPSVGVANGLAWTSVGGEVLKIEVLRLEGTGKIQMTGSLGDVMKESVDAAISYIRANHASFGIDNEFYKNSDIHIHFPEGATPKDGPSAGITIATALISELSGIPVKNDLVMTGEITLKGNVLPIGGLNEKLSAAVRLGYKTVLIPSKNSGDLEEVDKEVLSKLEIRFVSHMDEVAALALISDNFTDEKDNNKSISIPVKHDSASAVITQ